MALLMLLLVQQVLQVLERRSMPRFWRVVREGAGQHDGDRESPSFAREGEVEEGKVGVQGHEDGVVVAVAFEVVVAVAAFVLVLLVGAGTPAGMG